MGFKTASSYTFMLVRQKEFPIGKSDDFVWFATLASLHIDVAGRPEAVDTVIPLGAVGPQEFDL